MRDVNLVTYVDDAVTIPQVRVFAKQRICVSRWEQLLGKLLVPCGCGAGFEPATVGLSALFKSRLKPTRHKPCLVNLALST
jgi:hypothetical protein